MAISAVGGAGAAQLGQLLRQQMLSSAGATDAAGGAAGTAASSGIDAGTQARSANFADAVGQGLQQVASLDQTAATAATQVATGQTTNIHDYVIAATQAQTATELTTTLRNKAVDAFNEIMRMPL